MAKATEKTLDIEILKTKRKTVKIPIKGRSPLIVHMFHNDMDDRNRRTMDITTLKKRFKKDWRFLANPRNHPRFRGAFINWSMNLSIEYNPDLITPEQIRNLVDTSGFTVGIGDFRPGVGGSYGTFQVKQ